MKPFDLRSYALKRRYRIKLDPAWRQSDRDDRAWLYFIPTREGGEGSNIYLNSDAESEAALGFHGMSNRGVRKWAVREKLIAAGAHLKQEGDEEYTFTFPVRLLEAVEKIVVPIKRRKPNSPEQVEQAKANLKKYRQERATK